MFLRTLLVRPFLKLTAVRGDGQTRLAHESSTAYLRLIYGLYTAYIRLKGLTDNKRLPMINARWGRDFWDKRNCAPVTFIYGFRVCRPGTLFGLFQPIIRMNMYQKFKKKREDFLPSRLYLLIVLMNNANNGFKSSKTIFLLNFQTKISVSIALDCATRNKNLLNSV